MDFLQCMSTHEYNYGLQGEQSSLHKFNVNRGCVCGVHYLEGVTVLINFITFLQTAATSIESIELYEV